MNIKMWKYICSHYVAKKIFCSAIDKEGDAAGDDCLISLYRKVFRKSLIPTEYTKIAASYSLNSMRISQWCNSLQVNPAEIYYWSEYTFH